MRMLTIPTINQHEYNILDGESLRDIKHSENITCFIFANPLFKRLLNHNRSQARIMATVSEYNLYDRLFLASFNMNFFNKKNQNKRNFLKINFAFPHISIKKYKSLRNTSYMNTEDYIPFIVNPKLIRYNHTSFDPEKKESILSTAYVYRTKVEEDAYYYVKNINDFFEKTTGEVLFFRV